GEKATEVTMPPLTAATCAGRRVAWSCCVDTSHNLTVWSRLPDASVLESGEKANDVTSRACPRSVARSIPVFASRSFTVLSGPRQAKVVLSGDRAPAPVTATGASSWPVATSQTLAGKAPVATSDLPSGENAALCTAAGGRSTLGFSVVAISQSLRAPSTLTVASVLPSGEKATPDRGAVCAWLVRCFPVVTSQSRTVLSTPAV